MPIVGYPRGAQGHALGLELGRGAGGGRLPAFLRDTRARRRVRVGHAALPDAAVESAAVSTRARTGLVTIAGVAASLSLVTLGEAQPPIRVGASMAQTGSLAVPGHNMLRGYRLCVKHANDKGG